MGTSIGIVGLPNVGKSTLFNALTRKGAETANYPFCTIDPSVGVVLVPDARLEELSRFSSSKKTVPAIVEFVDIAGLVKGAAEGEGLGNQFLSHIRETSAIGEVIRIFEDENIIHVYNRVDPFDDLMTIHLELALADLDTVRKRRTAVSKDLRRGDQAALAEDHALLKLAMALETGKRAADAELTAEEIEITKQLGLITMKPILYILNKKSGSKNLDETNDPRYDRLIRYIKDTDGKYVVVDAKIESDLSDFEGAEKEMFAKELGVKNDGVNDLIVSAYDLLGLMTFFTTGEDETRAWTIKKGSTAPEAGAAIHTDFKDKFIRAEVIGYKDLLGAGSYGVAREKGLVRTEGKEYVVKDGDVIEFKI